MAFCTESALRSQSCVIVARNPKRWNIFYFAVRDGKGNAR